MRTVEERLASLEVKVDAIADLRNLIVEGRGEMNSRFTSNDARFTSIDVRFTSVETRLTNVETRLTAVETRLTHVETRLTEMNGRIGTFEAKVDRQFVWLMGMMITGFIGVIGALVGVAYT